MRCFRPRDLIAVLSVLGAPLAFAAESPWYGRVGLGWQQSDSIHLGDQDCASTAPPALFGCAVGDDGRPIGAYGDFGSSWLWELGAGYRLTPDWRVELNYSQAGGYDFSGQANFSHVSGGQPVSGNLTTHLLLAQLVRDIDLGWERVKPWIGIGAGWARHDLDRMTYGFPGLAPGAATLVSGGDSDQFAWRIDLGIAILLDTRFILDLGWNYTDLGKVQSDAGPATILRTRGTRVLDIAGTEGDLRVQGVRIGLRYLF
ncbi:porin family protein [Thiorhodococcus mannitoliphagus]|uniref:Porin family protein n=1 Tax=Thiorhodococcus mannitoliphagus TaxID=329406 RepID=A0A6P1DQI4_9GAMM|nr:outer membrane beta-barrel protein [Thiorhodococcus mannitoliphagus]NEX19413.1 porin family protein [Thiorhodococcus mannitoliphagus]